MAVYTAIDDPSIYFNTKLYTGTGSSLATTGVGFQPDLTWIKNRDANDFHVMTDAVRGATKYVQSNSTAAEVTDTETLTSFDSDGFTVGTTAEVNTNTEDYVSWNWKAGTTTGIAGSPSITPSAYSINATAGFSIILYTGNGVAGATIPHGLSAAPTCVLTKKRATGTDAWQFGHDWLNSGTTPWNGDLQLDKNDGYYASVGYWNNTAPTSTLVSFGTGSGSNENTSTYVAYCFTDIPGYSKFGNYIGNGDNDGTFVYLGFRPAFVLTKRTDTTTNFVMYDNRRVGYNAQNNFFYANLTNDADISNPISSYFLSNGWKAYNTVSQVAGGAYIYMAFAENPLVNSSGIPVNAR